MASFSLNNLFQFSLNLAEQGVGIKNRGRWNDISVTLPLSRDVAGIWVLDWGEGLCLYERSHCSKGCCHACGVLPAYVLSVKVREAVSFLSRQRVPEWRGIATRNLCQGLPVWTWRLSVYGDIETNVYLFTGLTLHKGLYFGKRLSSEREQSVSGTRLIPGLRQEEFAVTVGCGFVPRRRQCFWGMVAVCQEDRRAKLEMLPGPKSGTVWTSR